MPQIDWEALEKVSAALAAAPQPLGWTELHKQQISLAFIASRGQEDELARFARAVAAEEASLVAAAKADEKGPFLKVTYNDPADPDAGYPGADAEVLIPVRLDDALGLSQAFYDMTGGISPAQIEYYNSDELYDAAGNEIDEDLDEDKDPDEEDSVERATD
jgi:hypothetical protein